MSIQIKLESENGHGILLPELGISLDARFSGDTIPIISHAHADHVPYKTQKLVIASENTIQLMQARGFKGEMFGLAFFTPYSTPSAKITLYPAGHILGSSMIFIESEYGNLLYTGDFRFPASPVSEGCVFPDKPIDMFIAEATFGLPIYKWKSHETLANQIVDFAQNTINDGYNPIYLAYNLGKAQEVMYCLAKANISMQIHEAGFDLCSIYTNNGFDLGNYEKLNAKTAKGKALIMPSSVSDSSKVGSLSKTKTAYVSGWATLESRMQQMKIDERIPLSDHIDFYELLDVVEKLKPRKTYITHSPTPEIVCHFLKQRGFDAEPLGVVLQQADH